MATKKFCDKCWQQRVSHNGQITLAEVEKDAGKAPMPTLATHSVQSPTGGNIDACDAHLLDAVKDSLNNLRNQGGSCTVSIL